MLRKFLTQRIRPASTHKFAPTGVQLVSARVWKLASRS